MKKKLKNHNYQNNRKKDFKKYYYTPVCRVLYGLWYSGEMFNVLACKIKSLGFDTRFSQIFMFPFPDIKQRLHLIFFNFSLKWFAIPTYLPGYCTDNPKQEICFIGSFLCGCVDASKGSFHIVWLLVIEIT